MKVLIPQKVNTTGMANPYLFLLMRELHTLEEITELQHGYGWLYERESWNIIHLHWPEFIVRSQLADISRTDLLKSHHFKKVTDALKRRKSEGSKIILTVHNEKPHKNTSGVFDQFYNDIYQLTDAFIHMGEFSKKMVADEYPDAVSGKKNFLIPHGDYSYFPDNLKRSVCRERLDIDENEKLLLTFGAIRSKEELELGIDAFKNADIKNSTFLIAGSLPNPYRSQPEHFVTRRKLYTNFFNKRIRIHETVIPPEEVQVYLKAADLIFLPRFDTLNSGNVALGFTYGKVVIGPGYGVIGEILLDTGNPVFDPVDLQSVSDAIQEGFSLAESSHGIRNKEYANKHMKWEQIAKDTVEAYQSL